MVPDITETTHVWIYNNLLLKNGDEFKAIINETWSTGDNYVINEFTGGDGLYNISWNGANNGVSAEKVN